MEYFKTFQALLEKNSGGNTAKRAAVVRAEDEHTLEAVMKAEKDGIVKPILIGDTDKIQALLNSMMVGEQEIIHAQDAAQAAQIGVNMVKNGQADFIMKGKLDTKDLLKEVVNKETGIGKGRVMSHMAIHELPWYDKLLVTTDGGMMMYPSLDEKRDIIQNSVDALVAMGYDCPKVAVLAAVEKENPKMPESVEASALKEMCRKGEIKNAIVEGPISFDLAVNKEKATIKEYTGDVCGDADILVVPNITAGNILGKSLLEVEGVKMAGLILGAKVPIVLTSRGASMQEKYLSLLLAAAVAL